MLVCGQTGSGKTEFIIRFIDSRKKLFDDAPQHVYWYYGAKTKRHDDLIKRGYEMSDTLPETFANLQPKSIIVLDDLMDETKKNVAVTALFTKLAHHNEYFVIFTSQNIFFKTPEFRNRSLNTQYMVLFKNPRDAGQIRYLSQQMYPTKKDFLPQAYADATAFPHEYLFIDLHQKTSELIRLRARILPYQKPMCVYVDKQMFNDKGCLQ